MTQVLRPKSTFNEHMVKLVKLITQIGPDIPEISRRMGVHKETVRYWYKKYIIEKGFVIQAMANHEYLGLKRIVFVAEFEKQLKQFAESIFIAMNELCYVKSFAKLLLEDKYIVHASVPEEFLEKFRNFLSVLKKIGVFQSVSVYEFDWVRNIPMRSEKYDFKTGRWDLDLNAEPDLSAISYKPSAKGKFDDVDLLILKELEIDARKSLIEISERIGIDYKKMAWHYLNHVMNFGIVKGYRLNWMGTRYDYVLEKALNRKHRYFIVELLASDLSNEEKLELVSKLGLLPFVWSEALGKDYNAQIAIPVDYIFEVLHFLGESLSKIGERAKLHPLDQTDALAFTISYKLYDAEKKKWKFEPEALISKFEELTIKIRESAANS